MGAIPTTDMPGHKHLREKIVNALNRCEEYKSIEFKESAPWENLKFRLIKTALAMANLRDGGIIIIGVSERGDEWDCKGISEDHLASYDPDNVAAAMDKFASPSIEVSVVKHTHDDDNIFLVFQIREFAETPIVCKSNGNDNLKAGTVYVRTDGKVQTSQVMNATQMYDLLELSAEKRARRILEVSRRVGLGPSDTVKEMYDRELGGL